MDQVTANTQDGGNGDCCGVGGVGGGDNNDDDNDDNDDNSRHDNVVQLIMKCKLVLLHHNPIYIINPWSLNKVKQESTKYISISQNAVTAVNTYSFEFHLSFVFLAKMSLLHSF